MNQLEQVEEHHYDRASFFHALVASIGFEKAVNWLEDHRLGLLNSEIHPLDRLIHFLENNNIMI